MTKATPKSFKIEGKTFRVKDGTVEISMYDTMSRSFKLERKAKEYDIKVVYTK